MESTGSERSWETPTLTALGDLESLTSAGATGSEDGGGFSQ